MQSPTYRDSKGVYIAIAAPLVSEINDTHLREIACNSRIPGK
jgi:hypothetical protein